MIVLNTLKFKLTVDLVEEATGVKNEGEKWFKKLPFTFEAQRFLLPDVTPDWNKGIVIHKFRSEWVEPIRVLQSYITCEGRYAFVFKYHFIFFPAYGGGVLDESSLLLVQKPSENVQ